jgi:hypothetical protein
MEEDRTMQVVATGIMGFAGVMIGLGMAMAYMPQVTYYTCPLCGAQFTSAADLEEHFASDHPAEDIDIIWE